MTPDDRQKTSDEWTAMNKERERQAEQERVARGIVARFFDDYAIGGEKRKAVEARLVALQVETEAAVLEEAAREMEDANPKWLTGWAQHFRQQAKERRS